jgi:hypothetical protein
MGEDLSWSVEGLVVEGEGEVRYGGVIGGGRGLEVRYGELVVDGEG